MSERMEWNEINESRKFIDFPKGDHRRPPSLFDPRFVFRRLLSRVPRFRRCWKAFCVAARCVRVFVGGSGVVPPSSRTTALGVPKNGYGAQPRKSFDKGELSRFFFGRFAKCERGLRRDGVFRASAFSRSGVFDSTGVGKQPWAKLRLTTLFKHFWLSWRFSSP